MKTLGGPTLLERGKSTSNKDDDNDDPDGPALESKSATPSFASDRRIIRLVIARIFADLLQAKFLEQQQQPE